MVDQTTDMTQRPIRVLIAKPGLDGHDQGAKVVALALRDAGFEVIYTGLHRTVDQIVTAALQEDVDAIGLSILSGAHLPIAEQLQQRMKDEGIDDVPVFFGGNIPARDNDRLKELGVTAIYPTSARLEDIADGLGQVVTQVRGIVARQPPRDPRAQEASRHEVGAGRQEIAGEAETNPEAKARDVPEVKKEAGKKAGPRKPRARKVVLESGIEPLPVYGPEQVADLDLRHEVGEPGAFPFTRGIHDLMYRARPFTMRQYSGFGTPSQTNERFKYLIGEGQNALNVAFDLPTQMGLDSDDPRAAGEVGRVGMAVDTLADMEVAFKDIPLDRISTSLTINSTAPILVAMYLVVARKQGLAMDRIRGTAQNDILKEFVGRGTWIFPVEASIRLVIDVWEHCARHVPKYYPVSVCGYHIRESGANPVQEMAYAFAIATEYVRRMEGRGLDPEHFASQVSFNFDIHGNLFEQVAKFRAGRRLWANLVRDELGIANPKAQKLKMIAGGGGGGLTIEEPLNNIVRGAYYALISALSGTQTMALCSFDEAYTIPSKEAALVSLRTMQILVEEMGLADTVDPMGGSYYIEALTGELEKRIVKEMEQVEAWGGIVNAIAEGSLQRQVAAQAYAHERAVQSGEFVKVGVNKYRSGDDSQDRSVKLHEYEASAAEEQIGRLKQIKATRDQATVDRALKKLEQTARSDENLMPTIMEAIEVYATVGEIAAVFREVFGEFQEPVAL